MDNQDKKIKMARMIKELQKMPAMIEIMSQMQRAIQSYNKSLMLDKSLITNKDKHMELWCRKEAMQWVLNLFVRGEMLADKYVVDDNEGEKEL